ncbi:MAG: alpha/beta hydrolase [Chitinophagaceae bacterium]
MKLVQKIAIGYIRVKFRILSALSKKKAAKAAFKLFCTPPTRDVIKLTPIFEKAEKLQFNFQAYNITGYRWNKGVKRKVMIIHGFESCAINFSQYVEPLIAKGYEVLAFDAPAHGRSSGKRINIIIYKDLIKYVHEKYGPVQSFITHSFGGLALALALVEMKHDDSYRVALVSPATETTTAVDQFFTIIKVNDKIVKKEFEDIILEVGGHPSSWFSIYRVMPGIKANILWYHDEEDKVTPLQDALPIKNQNYSNVQFVITKGLGHSRIYRDANVSGAIIEFM